MTKYLALILFIILSSFAFFVLKDWEIVSGYTIKFDGKYARGSFEKLAGAISFDPENLSTAKFDVTVDVASINTGIDLKNKHAKSDKWFDAEKFPVIHFISSKVEKLDTSYVVHGELELRGIKKQLSIPFSFQKNETQSLFYGTFNVNRGDFGIGKSTGKDSDSTSVEVYVPVQGL
ncbi:YceI family protein [Dyadobacter arcticus]|uniref:Polyisoprenoid-binding protein YceI n=1 Tax=Dyadobacter arcticus TaxID=1078754 RepID=A0ABX0ULV5_9BACT|nr:YceI family protein [Dyadobacter arcticus]NIJ53986.1 polyisoprenoid-binding protein YceI [Dyadobacter arcticus]